MKLARRPQIQFVLPVHNQVRTLSSAMEELARAGAGVSEEADVSFLFIDDGSTDGTTQMLDRLHRERQDVRVIHLIHRFGPMAALACGVDHASGDLVVFLDLARGEDPHLLKPMYETWKKGARTVVVEDSAPPGRVGRLFLWLRARLRTRRLPERRANFRSHCLLDRSVLERMRELRETYRQFSDLVRFSSGKIVVLPSEPGEGVARPRKRLPLSQRLDEAATQFFTDPLTPLRFLSLVGFSATASGIGLAILAVLSSSPFQGNLPLLALISGLGGFHLLALGLLGEYLVRVYREVRRRPLYFVGTTLEPPEPGRRAPQSA